MRLLLLTLLVLHGAAHVRLLPRRRTRVSARDRRADVGWWAACVLFLAAASLLLLHSDSWTWPALVGVVLSQCLIVSRWSTAKLGSFSNALLIVLAVHAIAQTRFDQQVGGEIRTLLAVHSSMTSSKVSIVEPEELAHLPVPVVGWVRTSGAVGKERARTVRLKQRGELRTSPDGPWMGVTAEQYFSVEEPGFVWKVDTTMMKVVPVVGRDRLADGKGSMIIKAASLIDVVHAEDDKIAQGALLRFLGEIIWFPSAALRPYIAWEEIDDHRARAILRTGGQSVSAEFTFGTDGRVTKVEAVRFLGGGQGAKLTPWVATCSATRVVRGIELPVHGEVLWKLPGGDFPYYRWEVVDVEANTPDLY